MWAPPGRLSRTGGPSGAWRKARTYALDVPTCLSPRKLVLDLVLAHPLGLRVDHGLLLRDRLPLARTHGRIHLLDPVLAGVANTGVAGVVDTVERPGPLLRQHRLPLLDQL